MGLHHTYSLLAPIYDSMVRKATQQQRKLSIHALQQHDTNNCNILIPGIGTGLDIPYLPSNAHFYGLDITKKMLLKAEKRASSNIHLHQGNVMCMPYQDNSFDYAILHLILAVVKHPVQVLQETMRTLKPGGTVFIFDKFLKPDERAWFKKLLNPLISRIATRTNVVFEPLLEQTPQLKLISDEACMANGWFRRIVLQKQS